MSNTLDQAGYRAWEGQPHSSWWGTWTLVRFGMGLIFRRWLFWLLIGLGMMNFLFNFAFIYLKATIVVQAGGDMARFLDGYKVTGSGDAYLEFMTAQAAITALLLAFAGSTLIGNDYRQGGMIFYLSRSLSSAQYIVGKILAVSAVVLIITMLPAIVLYVQYGLLSSSFDYFRSEWRILLGIIGYGLVLALSQSLMLFAIAAWIPRTVPLVMTWLGLFTLLTALAHALYEIRDQKRWMLLALWDNMFRVGKWCFGAELGKRDPSAAESLAVLIGVGVVCLLLVIRRVRAVEVVA